MPLSLVRFRTLLYCFCRLSASRLSLLYSISRRLMRMPSCFICSSWAETFCSLLVVSSRRIERRTGRHRPRGSARASAARPWRSAAAPAGGCLGSGRVARPAALLIGVGAAQIAEQRGRLSELVSTGTCSASRSLSLRSSCSWLWRWSLRSFTSARASVYLSIWRATWLARSSRLTDSMSWLALKSYSATSASCRDLRKRSSSSASCCEVRAVIDLAALLGVGHKLIGDAIGDLFGPQLDRCGGRSLAARASQPPDRRSSATAALQRASSRLCGSFPPG
jgi:hypothetical protein